VTGAIVAVHGLVITGVVGAAAVHAVFVLFGVDAIVVGAGTIVFAFDFFEFCRHVYTCVISLTARFVPTEIVVLAKNGTLQVVGLRSKNVQDFRSVDDSAIRLLYLRRV
jgi:hypothetical protein